MIHGLIILDGFGYSKEVEHNAIAKARTPFIDSLFEKFPNTLISASGKSVGLPEGQMGNSEVGHMNIGAGRIVYQELTRISKEIEQGDFYQNAAFLDAIENAKKTKSKLHLIGLLSDGGVHSHINHLIALIDLAKKQGLDNVYIHCFLDGRDVAPTSGKSYLEELMIYLSNIQFGEIVSVMGRYYAMDRDERWDRTQIAYDAITAGAGEFTHDLLGTIEQRYEQGETDEFIKPIIVADDFIENEDSVIFFNFRPDRARQLTRALTEREFQHFPREIFPIVDFISMTMYDKMFVHVTVAYLPQKLDNTLGEYLSDLDKKQLRIAETEKYAHVTFFFNGGVEKPYENEDRILIKSPMVATYDLKPEMSAFEVAQTAAEQMDKYDLMVLNFANPDMVGHSGNLEATIKAIEAVDKALEIVVSRLLEIGGDCIITADHGNAEAMADCFNNPITAHTINKVPMIVVGQKINGLKEDGRLCDLAPTLLDMMDVDKPAEMEGISLIER